MKDVIEAGEYVRTENGKIDKVVSNNYYMEKYIEAEKDFIFCKNIVKHSKQLIDLIEIGDILELSEYVDYFKKSEKIGISDIDMLSDIKQAIRDKKIEVLSVLTKERYRANRYKVEGEKWKNINYGYENIIYLKMSMK